MVTPHEAGLNCILLIHIESFAVGLPEATDRELRVKPSADKARDRRHEHVSQKAHDSRVHNQIRHEPIAQQWYKLRPHVPQFRNDERERVQHDQRDDRLLERRWRGSAHGSYIVTANSGAQ